MLSRSTSSPALPSVPLVTFGGAAHEDVAMFIENIRTTAFTRGREQDDQWQAHLAASCLTGSALRWFSFQDDETQSSWIKLSLALTGAFRTPVGSSGRSQPGTPKSNPTKLSVPPNAHFTTPMQLHQPALGGGPPPSPIYLAPQPTFPPKNPESLSPSTAALILRLPTRKGRIRVINDATETFLGYLPCKISGNASYPAGFPREKSEESLTVGVPFRSFLCDFEWKIHITNAFAESNTSDAKRTHLDITRLGIRSLKQFCFVASPVGDGSSESGDGSPAVGHGVWNMELDPDGTEELRASWSKNDKSTPLHLNCHVNKKGCVRLWLTTFEDVDTRAKLIFEPI